MSNILSRREFISALGVVGFTAAPALPAIPAMRRHPMLRGIYGSFPCSSWLYHVEPLAGDCKPLLTGKAINSNKTKNQDKYPLTQPVAWTKTYKGARVFFATLGHPQALWVCRCHTTDLIC